MTIKVAMISPVAWRTPPRHYGPWELVASMITEGLVANGLDVTLFATKDSLTAGTLHGTADVGYEEDKEADPKVLEYFHLSEVFEHANEFDIIHNNFDFMPLAFSQLIKPPMITTIHGFSSPKILKMYKKFSGKTNYISISDSDRDESLEYLKTIHHGINIDDFSYGDIAEDYLLYFGRIHQDKGTKEAVQIAKAAGKRLIIAGIIQDELYFQKYVKPFIDNKQISYVGPAGPEKRNELLSKALCLIHPINFEEPFGLSVIEAFACGTPVIAYPKGSMPELIHHGLSGFLPKCENDFIKAIKNIDNISRKDCRQIAEDNFSKEVMVSKYIETYQQILEK